MVNSECYIAGAGYVSHQIVAQISLMHRNPNSGLKIGPETTVPLWEGERARLMPVAPDQRDESSGFRGSDECRSLLEGAMHETRRDRNCQRQNLPPAARFHRDPGK